MYFELERVVKGAEYRWVQREERPDGPPRWKDSLGREFWVKDALNRFAFIGHGSTVAYYLTALSQLSVSGAERMEDLYGAMLLFGITDPWQKEVRGSGFINHEVHQIGHWGPKVPEFSEDYMRREVFASQNEAAFQHAVKAGAKAIAEEVIAVKRLGDVFEIQTERASYFAAFVIVALGLGLSRDLGHAICPKPVPSLTPLNRSLFDGLVFTLDAFMQVYDEAPRMRGNVEHREIPAKKLSIAVHGTNAGIDAVQRAWQSGHEVIWIWGQGDAQFLPGHRLPVGKPQPDVKIEKLGRVAITLEPAEGRLKVFVNAEHKYTVDAYVIALGQDPFAAGCVGDVLITQSNLTLADFEPIYDFNQHFGLPFQTVLGFQTKGTRAGMGLQIIGGAVESLAKDPKFAVAHTYLEQLTPPGERPTLESCEEQLNLWPSLKKKYGTAQALLEYKMPHFERAEKNFIGQRKLAEAYLHGVMADKELGMLGLLMHQVDPTKVPKDLDKLVDSIGRDELDWFQKWQVATSSRPAGSAVASVLLPSQLGAVRAVVAALTNLIPDYIVNSKDANFNTDDRTMLAVHIAQNFPHLSGEQIEAEVLAKIDLRRRAYSPLGFYDDRVRQLVHERWQGQK